MGMGATEEVGVQWEGGVEGLGNTVYAEELGRDRSVRRRGAENKWEYEGD